MAFYKKFDRSSPSKGGFGPKKQGGGPNKGRYQDKAGPDERGREVERSASYGKPYAKPYGKPGRGGNAQGSSTRPGSNRPNTNQDHRGTINNRTSYGTINTDGGYRSGPVRRGPSPARFADNRQPNRPTTPVPHQFRVVDAPIAPITQEVNAMPAIAENLLSGRNPIREAIKTGRDIEKLLVASGELSGSAREIVAMARNAGIMIQTVERSRLDQLTRNHQGMVAFASAFAYAQVDEMLAFAKEKGEAPFLIILDKITDPQNLGAIIRSAACVGAHGVIVQQHRAVGLTPSAVRASAGAVEHVKVARVTNINQTIRDLKKRGIWVYAADTEGQDFRTVAFDGPCALVIGSEGEGVSQLTQELCDVTVSIPMSGVMDSFNASVAAGVLMYAVYSGRNAANKG